MEEKIRNLISGCKTTEQIELVLKKEAIKYKKDSRYVCRIEIVGETEIVTIKEVFNGFVVSSYGR